MVLKIRCKKNCWWFWCPFKTHGTKKGENMYEYTGFFEESGSGSVFQRPLVYRQYYVSMITLRT